MLLCIGLTFWMMFEYVGPFQWVAEFQIARFGSYSEKLTFVVAFMLVWAVLAVVGYPIRKLVGGGGGGGKPGGGGAGAGTNLSSGVLFVLVGLVIIGVAGWKHQKGARVPVSLPRSRSTNWKPAPPPPRRRRGSA